MSKSPKRVVESFSTGNSEIRIRLSVYSNGEAAVCLFPEKKLGFLKRLWCALCLVFKTDMSPIYRIDLSENDLIRFRGVANLSLHAKKKGQTRTGGVGNT